MESLKFASPVLIFTVQFGPQVFHDDLIVIPVEGVVGEDLKLGVGDVPVFIRCRLFQDGHEFDITSNFGFDVGRSLVNLVHHFCFLLFSN